MAGDWIKMRGNLWDDPRVTRICDLTDSVEPMVIGALYWLWATADQHTEDGSMQGLTLRQIDRKTGLKGFAAALCQVGWLTETADGVEIVHFEEHNGTSAKKRCQTAKRVAAFKSGNAASVTEALAERNLEKRREEENTHTALRADWALPEGWTAWTREQYPEWKPETVTLLSENFRDHHRSKGTETQDLQALWQKWCRDPLTHKTAKQAQPAEKGEKAAPAPSAAKAVAETDDYLRRERERVIPPRPIDLKALIRTPVKASA